MSGKGKKHPIIVPKAGQLVLVGDPQYTLPRDWFLAKVLWADRESILTEHDPPSGGRCRQVLSTDYVRAIGTIAELSAFKKTCSAAIAELQKEVRNCEGALERARDAVWEKVDEIAATTHAGDAA